MLLFFNSSALTLQLADILTRKGQQLVLALDAGLDGSAVATSYLIGRKVGIDDGFLTLGKTGIDNLVNGALDKGSEHLGTQIVHDQQVAV